MQEKNPRDAEGLTVSEQCGEGNARLTVQANSEQDAKLLMTKVEPTHHVEVPQCVE